MTGRRRGGGDSPPAPAGPTHAQLYRDAVWDADEDQLTTLEKLVLLAYANHARGTDRAWLVQRRLMRLCSINSHTTAVRLRRSLVDKGWLEPVGRAPVRGGQVVVYLLTIPESDTPGVSLRDDASDPLSGSLWDESDPLSDRKRSTEWSKAIHSVTESDPLSDTYSLDSRDSLVPESQRAAFAAASLRAAATANGHPAGTLSIEEAKRQIRETLKGARRAQLWRWPGSGATAPPVEPGRPGTDEPEGPPTHPDGEGDPL